MKTAGSLRSVNEASELKIAGVYCALSTCCEKTPVWFPDQVLQHQRARLCAIFRSFVAKKRYLSSNSIKQSGEGDLICHALWLHV